jgi:hypothetical protein
MEAGRCILHLTELIRSIFSSIFVVKNFSENFLVGKKFRRVKETLNRVNELKQI